MPTDKIAGETPHRSHKNNKSEKGKGELFLETYRGISLFHKENLALNNIEVLIEKPIIPQAEEKIKAGAFGFYASNGHVISLGLGSQNLVTIPDIIQNFKFLEFLSFFHNNLSILPNSLFQLNNLRTLDLSMNHLNSLPKIIANLNLLQELRISDNLIMTIPSEVSKLTSLKIIRMGGNKILILPESLNSIKDLEIFGLRGNNLKDLPLWILDFPSLKILDVSGNPVAEMYPLPPSAQTVVVALRARGVRLDPPYIGEDPDAVPWFPEEPNFSIK